MADRKTKRHAQRNTRNFPVADSALIELGKIVMLNATGFALEGATATGQVMVGLATQRVDNSAGSDGDLTVEVSIDVAAWDSGTAGDTIDGEDIGATVYIIDDETVGLTDGGASRSVAGVVYQFDTNGVWVIPPNG